MRIVPLLFTLTLVGVSAPASSSPTMLRAAIAYSTAAPAAALRLFSTEDAAGAHRPKDEVVWLDTNSGIYHEKGMRWYGRTKHGAFVCRREADAAGDRDTRNRQ